MRLVLSRLAAAELDEILGYIRERSPLGARSVEARVRHAFDHISRHPEAAERVEQRPTVRRLPLARYPYVIYYEVGAGAVTVLRILHGARRRPRDEPGG
ncbi:MAG: type II toxin-antitoxin system RelE/ParE family toxin [Alphaproteobacteria bacterium]|nr:MAG: type II toxin-antitoxin system RelE/ParE family toxin [Alphaproteobacteria bacterium]